MTNQENAQPMQHNNSLPRPNRGLGTADPAGWAICKRRFWYGNLEKYSECHAGRLSSRPLGDFKPGEDIRSAKRELACDYKDWILGVVPDASSAGGCLRYIALYVMAAISPAE